MKQKMRKIFEAKKVPLMDAGDLSDDLPGGISPSGSARERDELDELDDDSGMMSGLPPMPKELTLQPVDPHYGGTNIPAFSYKAIEHFLKKSYFLRQKGDNLSFMLYGDPGVGKTVLIEDVAERIAIAEGREFIRADEKGDREDRYQEIIDNPEKFFLFSDVSASELDPTDISGIPQMSVDKPWLVVKHHPWAYLLSIKGVKGILFIDEVGAGSPEVQRGMLKLALQRKLGPMRLNSSVCIFGASNLPENIQPGTDNFGLSSPNLNRFQIAALVVNKEEWADYARARKVDPIIIRFAIHEPELNLFFKPKREENIQYGEYATPRSVFSYAVRFNQLKVDEVKHKARGEDYDFWSNAFADALLYLGAAWGTSFKSYVTHYLGIRWKPYVKAPSMIKGHTKNQMAGLVIVVSKRIDAAQRVSPERKLQTYNEVAELLTHVDPETQHAFISEIKDTYPKAFEDFIKEWAFHGKYAKPAVAIAWRGSDKSSEEDPDERVTPKSILGVFMEAVRRQMSGGS